MFVQEHGDISGLPKGCIYFFGGRLILRSFLYRQARDSQLEVTGAGRPRWSHDQ